MKPEGEKATVPVPVPAANVTVKSGPDPPLVLVKQTTFACILPVTIAPDDGRFPALLLVCTVAEITVPPHEPPVAIIRPVEFTVTI